MTASNINIPYEIYTELIYNNETLEILQAMLTPIVIIATFCFILLVSACVYFWVKWMEEKEKSREWKNLADEMIKEYRELEDRKLTCIRTRIPNTTRLRSRIQ